MNKITLLITAILSLALNPLLAQSGVAIVDLDAVAKELGVLDHITESLKSETTALNTQLKTMQENLQAQMNKVIKELGDTPSKEQKQKAALTNRELEIQFQKARGQAMKKVQSQRVNLISKFRADLKPYALEEAKKKNCSVVLNTVMPPVYAFDSSVDITLTLIATAKKAGLAK